jgi:hypothetical protein
MLIKKLAMHAVRRLTICFCLMAQDPRNPHNKAATAHASKTSMNLGGTATLPKQPQLATPLTVPIQATPAINANKRLAAGTEIDGRNRHSSATPITTSTADPPIAKIVFNPSPGEWNAATPFKMTAKQSTAPSMRSV